MPPLGIIERGYARWAASVHFEASSGDSGYAPLPKRYVGIITVLQRCSQGRPALAALASDQELSLIVERVMAATLSTIVLAGCVSQATQQALQASHAQCTADLAKGATFMSSPACGQFTALQV